MRTSVPAEEYDEETYDQAMQLTVSIENDADDLSIIAVELGIDISEEYERLIDALFDLSAKFSVPDEEDA